MAGLLQKFFQIDNIRAKSRGCFRLRHLHRGEQCCLIVHHAHAAATATGSSFNNHRIADAPGNFKGMLGVFCQRSVRARNCREPRPVSWPG